MPPVARTEPSASRVELSWRRPVDSELTGVTTGASPLLSSTTAVLVGTFGTPSSVMLPPPSTIDLPMSYVAKPP